MAKQSPDAPAPEQPLIEHLLELRSRLLKCVIAVILLFCCIYPFANEVYLIVAEPLRIHLPTGTTMIATEVTSPFFTPLKLSMVMAAFLAVPFMLYQIWSFIAPGLYQHEKRLALPLFASSVILFYLGVLFAYFVVFPLVFSFFTSVGPEGIAVMPDINSYLNIVLKMFFAFGITFEIPVATILLIKSGVTSVASLKAKRPYIFVGCFIVGMLLTPPDVISQTLLAVPMWLLFEAGVFFGRFVEKPQNREEVEDAESHQDSNLGS